MDHIKHGCAETARSERAEITDTKRDTRKGGGAPTGARGFESHTMHKSDADREVKAMKCECGQEITSGEEWQKGKCSKCEEAELTCTVCNNRVEYTALVETGRGRGHFECLEPWSKPQPRV